MDTFENINWKHWLCVVDSSTCMVCYSSRGKIYAVQEMVENEPPVHENCRCIIAAMQSILAGQATKSGIFGADIWVKFFDKLPDYYINKQKAKALGWVNYLGNLSKVAPGMMIGGNVYKNTNGHLPDAPGRIWYEADINYKSGVRNSDRLLYSNDGLIFVTYGHYETFFEVI